MSRSVAKSAGMLAKLLHVRHVNTLRQYVQPVDVRPEFRLNLRMIGQCIAVSALQR
jgi:hypothetical protein